MRPNFLNIPDRAPAMRSALKVPFGSPRPISVTTRPAMNARNVAHSAMTLAAKSFLRRMTGRDVGALNTDGTWTVVAGDTGMKIAKAVTGDSSRWKELIAVNPKNMANAADVKAYGFPVYTYKYNPINLPASWIKTAPSPQPTPENPIPSAPIPVAPAGDIAAMGAARLQLMGWGNTDGKGQAGTPDYGSIADMAMLSWSARDKFQAASFENWWNKSGFTPMQADGEFTQQLSNNLKTWTEKRATQILNPAPSAPAPAATGIPSPTTPPNAPTTAPAANAGMTRQQALTLAATALATGDSGTMRSTANDVRNGGYEDIAAGLENAARIADAARAAIPALPAASTPASQSGPSAPASSTLPVPMQPTLPNPASPAASTQKAPMTPQAKGAIMAGAGLLANIIAPAIAKALFGSNTAPPMPI
jgi:hypothetical protein